MNKQLIGTMIVLSIVLAVNASDYFPAKIGSKWEFDYVSFVGHSAGGETDLGIVSWTITTTGQKGNVKEITIRQNRNLRRKTYSMYGKGYDSIFNPPRDLPSENISFIDSGNVLYRTYQRDSRQTTEVLMHDPKGAIPSSICVHDTTSVVLKTKRAAKLVITGSCDLSQDLNESQAKHPIFDFFFQCDSIGPVEYHYDSHGTSMMVGGHNWENWNLHSLPVSIKRELAQTKSNYINSNRPKTILITNGSVHPAYGSNLICDLRGRIMPRENSFEKHARANAVFIRLPQNVQSVKQQY